MSCHKKRNQSGFTLYELVAALFVLTTGMFGGMTLYLSVIANMQVNAINAAARAAVQNEIEAVRALPFAEVSLPGEQPFRTDPATQGIDEVNGVVTILPWPGLDGDLVEVRVMLEYRNGRRMVTFEESTLLAEAVS